jgi:DNA-directed RNA polymerase subunit M/transcription elongation factor TFIIS
MIATILEEYTKLKPGQRKVLSKMILKYDEAEDLLHETIGQLNSGVPYTKVKADFLNKEFLWDSACFREYKDRRAMQDKALEEPPEMREGEMECPKCNSKKTFVVEMQTRSADEGFTYSIHCFNPKCRAITK